MMRQILSALAHGHARGLHDPSCIFPLASWPSCRRCCVGSLFERMRARDDYTGQDQGDAAAASLVRQRTECFTEFLGPRVSGTDDLYPACGEGEMILLQMYVSVTTQALVGWSLHLLDGVREGRDSVNVDILSGIVRSSKSQSSKCSPYMLVEEAQSGLGLAPGEINTFCSGFPS